MRILQPRFWKRFLTPAFEHEVARYIRFEFCRCDLGTQRWGEQRRT
jgi:hypothetical protein